MPLSVSENWRKCYDKVWGRISLETRGYPTIAALQMDVTLYFDRLFGFIASDVDDCRSHSLGPPDGQVVAKLIMRSNTHCELIK